MSWKRFEGRGSPYAFDVSGKRKLARRTEGEEEKKKVHFEETRENFLIIVLCCPQEGDWAKVNGRRSCADLPTSAIQVP